VDCIVIDETMKEKPMEKIISLSGGKDSTAMLLKMIENNYKFDRVIFVDTTKEFPQMYDHFERLKQACPVEIEIVKLPFDYWFAEHKRVKWSKYKNIVGFGWPNFINRWCTGRKERLFNSVVNKKNNLQYHGIAFNEQNRIEKNRNKFVVHPLVEWGMTEKDTLQYCYKKGYDWGGLYEKFHRVSCWCCPFSRISELKTLYFDFPELWKKLETMDKKAWNKFRPSYSVEELKNKFETEKGD
jgi:3'-phosphoadenosine 5'-phosphosulfate sulfotransferase (PAPS reductase)/FAD synthetase